MQRDKEIQDRIDVTKTELRAKEAQEDREERERKDPELKKERLRREQRDREMAAEDDREAERLGITPPFGGQYWG